MKNADSKTTRKSKPVKKKEGKPCANNHGVDIKPARNPQKPVPNLSKPAPKMTLNAKQTLFCLEYLVDLNATQAAIRAGYSVRTARRMGSLNMTNCDIKAAIDAEIDRRRGDCEIRAGQVDDEVDLLAHSDIKDFVRVDEGGAVQAIPLAEMGKHSRAVKKIKEKTVIAESKDGSVIYKTSTIEYELYDKVRALELKARRHGLLHDKQEVTGKGGGPVEHKVTVVYDDKAV